MRPRSFIAAALSATLLVGAVPSHALADNGESPAPAAPATLRASIDRAAVQLAAQPSSDARRQRSESNAAQAVPMGGGGGKGMLIVSLVSTVVGLGATYYLLKEMKKQTDQAGQ